MVIYDVSMKIKTSNRLLSITKSWCRHYVSFMMVETDLVAPRTMSLVGVLQTAAVYF